ncbi:hypothetical protein NW768_007241 [Fusarium equiseti]|uniref:Methyltransferase type 11 domain-containing protein n=1 Tax=Fusarium equiseti TaxID=61235 RepID=A0ABQ8RAG5_FUSEQ|nr:hypothetical protein NW768_007241 [Fusarium equiseti]
MAQTSYPEDQPRDAIFRNFTAQQATNYAEGRIGYSEKLIDFVLTEHNSTGGSNGTVLDVGCGPGPATRLLAPHFDIVCGADPGESMIQTAKELGGVSRSGNPILYEVVGAESIDKINGLEHSSVDLITAATAAHWFDMPQFWKAAAELLKPGGTVAIWTVFRNSNQTNDKLSAIFDDFSENVLAPYTSAGTKLTHDGYINLPMPWDDPETASLYDKKSSARHELKAKDGYLPKTYTRFTETGGIPLDKQLMMFEKLVHSFGTVNRWQEANSELVGTEGDIVKILLQKIRDAAEANGGSLDWSVLADRLAVAVILVKRA